MDPPSSKNYYSLVRIGKQNNPLLCASPNLSISVPSFIISLGYPFKCGEGIKQVNKDYNVLYFWLQFLFNLVHTSTGLFNTLYK